MSNRLPYTKKEMRGKYVVFSKILSEKHSTIDCVRYSSGPRSGLPVLYDSIDSAKKDRYFDNLWDEIIPASEYFDMVANKEKAVI